MSQQPIEANVVLTADTSQYDQSLNQSASNTDQLGKSVDSLTGKLDKLSKSAGRKLFGIAAGDVATITAGVAAYAAWERQMTSLSAQAAVLNRTVDQQRSTFNSYATSVDSLRARFGTTTSEAADLVQTLSRLSDNTTSVDRLATSFTKLGQTTGESSSMLSQNMLQLQKAMGTPQRDTERYNNQLAVLSANSTAGANAILNFSQQLAPVGRLAGMSQTDIMGLSSAFLKSGQDGIQAANVFSKMVSDVAYATQSGSPDLAKYADLVGLTVDQFKQLGGTDQIVRIFDAINQQGPNAITTLNRMGLDGMRTVRTITAMAQQSGGLQAAINQAQNADPNALNRGNDAAQKGIVDSLKRMRSELALTGEAFGRNFSGPARMFVDSMEGVTAVVRELMQGPFGKMAAVVAGIAAPFAALAGVILTAAKALTVYTAANQLFVNSGTQGFRAGRAGFGAIGQEGMALSQTGRNIAAEGNFVQRRTYNAAARLGQLSIFRRNPEAEGPGFASRFFGPVAAGTGALGGYGARMIGYQFSPGTLRGMDNPERREKFFTAPTAREALRNGYGAAVTGAVDVADAVRPGMGERIRGFGDRMEARASIRTDPTVRDPRRLSQAVETFMQATQGASTAMEDAGKSGRSFGQGVREGASSLVRGLSSMFGSMTSAGAGGLLRGGGMLLRGLDAIGINPLMLGLAGGAAGYAAIKGLVTPQGQYTARDTSGFSNAYFQAGNIAPPSAFTPGTVVQQTPTLRAAYKIDTQDRLTAGGGYQLKNTQLKGLTARQALARLAPNFAALRDSPQAVETLSLDLTHQYGQKTAQAILNQLQQGATGDVSSFITAGLNQPAAGGGFLNIHKLSGDEDRSKVSRQFENLFGTYKDERNQVSTARGASVAAQLQQQQIGQSIMEFARQTGRFTNPEPARGRITALLPDQTGHDTNQTERTAFLKSLLADMGIRGVSDADITKLTLPTGAKTPEEASRGLLNEIYTSGSKDLQAKTTSALNVPTGAVGQQAANYAYATLGGSRLGPFEPNTMQRAAMIPGGARDIINSTDVQNAIAKPGDMNAQLMAVNTMVRSLSNGNIVESAEAVTKMMGRFRATAGNEDLPLYQISAAAQQQANRQLSFAMPSMTRTQQFAAGSGMFVARMQAAKGDPNQQQLQQQAEDDYFTQTAEPTRQYFQGLLMQQREFNIAQSRAQYDFSLQRSRMDEQYNLQRSRAEEDFHQQQMYQLQDYQRSRARASQDFHIQEQRQAADFARNQARSLHDYNLARMRQEQDFHHQARLMIEQTAKTAYNIYQRIPIQATSSASYTLLNAQEQNQALQEQASNLDKLRKMGLSNQSIRQLDLANPANAQQAERYVGDFEEDPRLVKQFNQAIQKRLKAASKLTTDESSTQWTEYVRGYKLARSRAQQDFSTSVERARADFHRSQNRQEADFGRSMERMAQDFETANNRQQTQFHKSMDRNAQDYKIATDQMTEDFHTQMMRAQRDLDRSATQIDGTLEDLLTQGVNKLSGHAQKQAAAALREFKNMKTQIGPVAIDLMQSLGKIFGVDYHAPKLPGISTSSGSTPTDRHHLKDPGAAQGAVLPGFTPGQDVHHFYSPTAGGLHLSGGEAVMVPEWTRAVGGEKAVAKMNHDARHGKREFARGGVISNPDKPVSWGGKTISKIAAAQLSLAEHISGKNLYLMQGGYGGDHIRASGTSHNYPGVGDVAPGSIAVERLLRRVGFAAWARNIPGRSTAGSGAHVHSVSLLDPGDRNSPQVYGSWAHHGNGLSGYNNDPAPHYAWIPNLLQLLGAVNLTNFGEGMAGVMGSGKRLKDILHKYYARVETAANMDAMRPLKFGDASGIINRMARQKYQMMKEHYGNPNAGGGSIPGGSGSVMSGDPHQVGKTVAAAVNAGRQMAAARGWTGGQWEALNKLWTRESGWRWNADNPNSSAYGIPQALPGSKMASAGADWRTNPETQIRWGLGYIKDRYGTPKNAWAHEQAKGWYGDGAVFTGPTQIGIGERGPEAVLPLNRRGAEFISDILRKTQGGNDAKAVNTHGYNVPATIHNMHNYSIDRSTNFTGAITVQAQNPRQMLNELKAQARLSALSNAAKGGVKVA